MRLVDLSNKFIRYCYDREDDDDVIAPGSIVAKKVYQ